MKKIKMFIIVFLLVALSVTSVYFAYKYFNQDVNNLETSNIIKEGIVKEEENTSGDKVSLAYSNIVSVDLVEKKVSMYLKNPGKSIKKIKVDVVLYDDDNQITIASSGPVDIGYTIYSLDLLNVDIKTGKFDGKFIVTYYDEDADTADMVNSTIDTRITVK